MRSYTLIIADAYTYADANYFCIGEDRNLDSLDQDPVGIRWILC
ncbi:MAG: hypothetical protein WCI87_09345 [Euryarchaeota archaeon]